ncbi:FAS1-like dehydratase domain-containing protein [Enemella sp. A6]|uniref:FAS1-like dehydratase domain-containing protein n=1 Tax=Enemella sp. A6 TaxID=3440152 RepID=UPI003EBB06B3
MTTELNFEPFLGEVAEPPRVSRYAVNEAMIRNWVEAHEDENPVYVDRETARATGRTDIICPPAMISTWVMAGLRRFREIHRKREAGEVEDFAYSRLMAVLDEAGYTSVVATNVDQEYVRELHPGDEVTCHFTIESVVGPKTTGLGEGYFITLDKRYVDQHGEPLVNEKFRILRFRPGSNQ